MTPKKLLHFLRDVARVAEDAAGTEDDEASAGGEVEIVDVVGDLGCCSPQTVSIVSLPIRTNA